MADNKKIGLIGAGNMGKAFIGAMIRANVSEPSRIYVKDVVEARLDVLRQQYGINTVEDSSILFNTCDVVVFAVKPQQMGSLLAEISGREGYHISDRKIVLSIAAGISLKTIEYFLYNPLDDPSKEQLPIIRVMPNTPALVLAGMFGMSPNRYASAEDMTVTRNILSTMGRVIEFKEDELDAVTALSGSGPAYVFYLIESMIQGGIDAGLDPKDASDLTLATLKGSLALIEDREESPEHLRHQVTSPGGTTEAAFGVLEKNRVKQSFIDAIVTAKDRSIELSESIELK